MIMPTSITEKLVLVFAFGLLLLGAVLSYTHADFFRNTYTIEDGAIEWFTVVALLIAMVISARRVIVLRREKGIAFLVMTSLLTLFCLFGAGEEISWGQRIFGLETPEYFSERNAQGEIGFHNFRFEWNGETVKINKLVFGTGLAFMLLLYLAVFTPIYRKQKGFQRFVNNLAVPMPKNYHIIGYVAIVVIVELLMEHSKKGELTEFAGSFLFMLNIAFPHNSENFQSSALPRATEAANA